ncbi:fosfomycin resistance protein FosB [Bacillus sp. SG-1]|nr:fosfomycin resistance protein FosB [Bacillus sp. SG-1]
MLVKGFNHFLFSVSDLERSIQFYQKVFDARLLVKGRTTAYFDLNGMWLALNEETDVERGNDSYTHIAFSIEEEDYHVVFEKLLGPGVTYCQDEIEVMRTRNRYILQIPTAINLSSTQVHWKTG